MSYDSWAWGAMAAVALFTVDTGGGGHVGGDARTGRDFSGRDRSEININNNPGQRHNDDGPDEDSLEWQTLIYGNDRANYPGILNRLRALESENKLFRVGGVVIFILLISLAAALVIIIRSWGG